MTRARRAPGSIHAVFDATWRQLHEHEQALFAALSVFRGGFSRAAAEEVGGATMRQLSGLAAKSLIHFDRVRNRYTLHEMVRQFASSKLADSPVQEALVRRRHSVRYCTIAQTLGIELLGARQIEAIGRAEPQAENLRVAWQWAIDQLEWPLVKMSMDGLGRFYEWLGRLQDGVAGAQIAVSALRAADDAVAHILLGEALTWCSVFAFAQGKTDDAVEQLKEALRLLEGESESEAEEGLVVKRAFAWLQAGIQATSWGR
ncbi:MAG: hypothetical protein HC802_11460 [Caldilineaceae bacterium]|nr:hypothetical protein [Caldilineaceae bacterium]